MKRVLLIRQTTNFSYPMIGAGIGTIATLLHNAGHEIRVIDNNSVYKFYNDSRLLRIVKHYDPDVVAFSITIVNALATYTLLRKLKNKFPEKIYLAGGMHAKSSFKEILENGFDIVVNKEGERIILDLFSYLEGKTRKNMFEGLDTVPGVSFKRKDGTIHEASNFPAEEILDEIPYVNYNLFNIKDFFKNKREPAVILINGQRGCPYKCTFCSDEDLRKDRRLASAEYIFNYVKYLYEEYKTSYIWLADNNFFIPRKRALDFCRKMIKSGLNEKVSLVAQTKIESVFDSQLLELVKNAGFAKIGFGLERLEPFSQKQICKETSLEKTHRILSLVRRHGINISVNIILGFPFDTVELIQKERDLFMEISQYTQNIISNVLTPIPLTVYYDDYPKAHGWHLDPRAISISRSFYGNVMDLNLTDVLDINYFDLPVEVIKKIKSTIQEFKHFNHGRHVAQKTIFLTIASKVDLFFAHVSKFVFAVSPKFEFWVFRKLLFVRYYFATLLFKNKIIDV